MVMGDYYIETVRTRDDIRFRLGPVFVDVVSDLAILGPLDDQEFGEEVDTFEQWSESIEPVPLMTEIPQQGEPIAAHVLTHKGEWVGAKIEQYGYDPIRCGGVCIEAHEQIEGGTSGGPVVDSRCRLVGIVPHCTDGASDGSCVGSLPVLSLASPRWLWMRITGAATAIPRE